MRAHVIDRKIGIDWSTSLRELIDTNYHIHKRTNKTNVTSQTVMEEKKNQRLLSCITKRKVSGLSGSVQHADVCQR